MSARATQGLPHEPSQPRLPADCVEREDIIMRIEALGPVQYEAEPSELVGEWTKPQMKGYLTKDAVQSKSNSKKRYFVLMGNFLMYYEDAKDSVFHPKGVWCLEDCRKGFMKRPGLNERQAVLLRGKRELVITADSLEDLKEWNRSVQEASKYTVRNFHELQRSSEAELAKLRSHWDSMLVELEVTRSKLREEREARSKLQLETETAQINTSQMLEQSKALEQTKKELEEREASMRTMLESEKQKVHDERKVTEEERMRYLNQESEAQAAAEQQALLMQTQMEELRQQLHKEIEARQAADILKEAAIKAQLEMEDKQQDLQWQVGNLRAQAMHAREEAQRLEEASTEATLIARTSIVGGAQPGNPSAEEAQVAAAAAAAAADTANAMEAEVEAAAKRLEEQVIEDAETEPGTVMAEAHECLQQLKQLCSRWDLAATIEPFVMCRRKAACLAPSAAPSM